MTYTIGQQTMAKGMMRIANFIEHSYGSPLRDEKLRVSRYPTGSGGVGYGKDLAGRFSVNTEVYVWPFLVNRESGLLAFPSGRLLEGLLQYYKPHLHVPFDDVTNEGVTIMTMYRTLRKLDIPENQIKLAAMMDRAGVTDASVVDLTQYKDAIQPGFKHPLKMVIPPKDASPKRPSKDDMLGELQRRGRIPTHDAILTSPSIPRITLERYYNEYYPELPPTLVALTVLEVTGRGKIPRELISGITRT